MGAQRNMQRNRGWVHGWVQRSQSDSGYQGARAGAAMHGRLSKSTAVGTAAGSRDREIGTLSGVLSVWS